MSSSRLPSRPSLPSEPSSSTLPPPQPRKPTPASSSRHSHLKRNESIVSLPSPNSSPMEAPHPVYTRGGRKGEREVDALGPRLEPGFEHDLARGRASRNGPAFADEEQDDSEDEDGVEDELRVGSSRAANLFTMTANEANAQAGSSRDLRPDHPQASPTHLRRRRIDTQKTLPVGKKLFAAELEKTPPPQVPSHMGKGWEDDNNPFIENKAKPQPSRPIKRKTDERVAYVFRGKRMTYDIPIQHILASPDSPNSDDPFHTTVPRRLFQRDATPPPSDRPVRSSPRLAASHLVSPKKRPNPEDHGLPTPVQESRKKARQEDWSRNLKR